MDDLAAAADTLPLEERPLKVLLVAGSARRLDGCPGLDGKARFLMHRMLARLPPAWQADHVDLGNEHGKPKIQGCNGCVGTSMALCVWPCNCYGPDSDHQPDLLWNERLYPRLARADAWAFIGPVRVRFDAWADAFVRHVADKGVVPGTEAAERGAQATT